ncbi:MAG TPA: NPCBM/NEW2 domain-containing protein [Pirellulales bacterium]|nr:NPCBM/NEW2 domain-containing protein [Pirellulales bacterium]
MTNDILHDRRVFLAGSLAAAAGTASRRALAQVAGVAPVTVEVIPVEGDRFPAALAAVGASGELRFRTTAGDRRLAAADLVAWGSPTEPAADLQVHLTDGGLLIAAQLLESDQRTLKFDSDEFGEVAVPLDLVSGIQFHPPADHDGRDHLALRLSKKGTDSNSAGLDRRAPGGKKGSRFRFTDQLLLVNGDELKGKLVRLTATTVEFETDAGPIAPEFDKVAAVVLDRSPRAAASGEGLRIVTGFRDGSSLVAESLTLDDRQAHVELAGALELAAEADKIVALQSLGGRAEYLSDLRAESYRHVPFLDLAWPYRGDACVAGSRLRAGGRLYLKGIGMHSASRLTYRIDGKPYGRFAAELAVDDRTEGRGSVVYRVFVDDREAYKSPVVRGRMPLVPISVDVTGGKRLSLVVDFAERGDELDHADWLDARLMD